MVTDPTWEVVSAEMHTPSLATLLRAGWEPFAVTPDGYSHRIWLKRKKQ